MTGWTSKLSALTPIGGDVVIRADFADRATVLGAAKPRKLNHLKTNMPTAQQLRRTKTSSWHRSACRMRMWRRQRLRGIQRSRGIQRVPHLVS